MIDKLVKKCLEIQLKNEFIQKEDISVYQYGYTLIIETILNVCFTLSIGIILGQIREIMFFLAVFIPLRSFCGGYHASGTWKCIFLSNFVSIGTVCMAQFMENFLITQPVIVFLTVGVALIIVFLAPVDSHNKRLDKYEKKRYKSIAMIVLAIEVLVVIIMLIIKMQRYSYIVCLAFIIQLISLFGALIQDILNKCY